MPNNLQNPSSLDIQPAMIVGGMRVKQPDSNRIPLRADAEAEAESTNINEDSKDLANRDQLNDEMERESMRALQERQAHDMQAHAASRQPDISKNAGSNVKDIHITQNIQPRSMNH